MRFADLTSLRPLAAAVLCAIAGFTSTASQAADAPAAAAVPVPAPTAAAPAVDAAVQQAFDAALAALRAGNTAEAERGLRALAQSHPELGGVHANLGLLLGKAGKRDEAVAELEQAVKASPRQPVFYNQLGIAYRQQGQFRKARDAYRRAVALDPRYAAAYLNLGILHDLYLADADLALELYERYLALSPGGDATVNKWVADLKNRKARGEQAQRKEQP